MRASFLNPVLTRCSKGEGVTSRRAPCVRRVDELCEEREPDDVVREGAERPVRPDCGDVRRALLEVDRVDEERCEAERDELDRVELRRD